MIALAVSAMTYAFGQTWQATSDGNWSDTSNWLGGVAPQSGGSDTDVISFLTSGGGGFTSTNDLGNFHLNSLILNTDTTSPVTIASATGSSLWFAGVDPTISFLGQGDVNISSDINLTSSLTISGNGAGNLNLSGVIGGTGGLTFSDNSTNGGSVTLNGHNSFSGGTVINAGANVTGIQADAFGTGNIVANGGSLQINGNSLNNVQLNGILNLNGGFSGTVSGTGGLTGNVTINGLADYTGSTVASNLSVTSTGFLTSTSSITSTGILNINEAYDSTGNRIDPSIAIHMVQSFFTDSGGNHSQQVGAVDGVGANTIAVDGTLDSSIQLQTKSLSSKDGGTFWIQAANLGKSGTGSSQLTSVQAPTEVGHGGPAGSTEQSIVPFMVSDVNANSASQTMDSFVTYGQNGYTPLDVNTEYGLDFSDPNANVIAKNLNNDATVTVNSLIVEGSLTGAGTIMDTSGAVMTPDGSGGYTTNSINFGDAHAYIFSNQAGLGLEGNLIGTGGISVSAEFQGVSFGGDNSGLTGEFDWNNGELQIKSNASLPGTGAIVVHEGTLYNGNTDPITVGRDFKIEGNLNFNGPYNVTGNISGSGNLGVGSLGTPDALLGTNTYTGNTTIFSNTYVQSDSEFGLGGPILIDSSPNAGPVLQANWTSQRTITMEAGAVNTNSFDATWNGNIGILGYSNFVKMGQGNLILNGNLVKGLSGVISIQQGGVVANGSLSGIGFEIGKATSTSGTLSGTGAVGDVLLGANGQISTGAKGVGTLSLASLKWNGGGAIDEALGQSPGLLAISGAFQHWSTNGGTTFEFNFSNSGGLTPGTYSLVTFGSESGFSASNFSYSGPTGLKGTFSLEANSLDFKVAAAPEPSEVLALAPLFTLVALRRRKK